MLAAPETPLHVAVTVSDCADAFAFTDTMADEVGLFTAIRTDPLFVYQVKLHARETSEGLIHQVPQPEVEMGTQNGHPFEV